MKNNFLSSNIIWYNRKLNESVFSPFLLVYNTEPFFFFPFSHTSLISHPYIISHRYKLIWQQFCQNFIFLFCFFLFIDRYLMVLNCVELCVTHKSYDEIFWYSQILRKRLLKIYTDGRINKDGFHRLIFSCLYSFFESGLLGLV